MAGSHSRFSVDQAIPLEVRYITPGGEQDGMASGRVPFHRPSKPWIEIRLALGHEAELERRARAHGRGHRAPGEEPLEGYGIAVGAAGDHDEPTLAAPGASDGTARARIPHERALSPRAAVEAFQRRGENHAEHRRAAVDQGDVDRELPIAIDELLCPI
jgi:hypothetical protein